MNDIERFTKCHKEDPTYTRYHAYKDYLSLHPEEIIRIAKTFWNDVDDEDQVVDRDFFREVIASKTPIQAFRMGLMASGLKGTPFDWDSNYFRFPGDGNVESVTDIQYKDLCLDAADDAYESVISGDVKVSEGLEEVLRIFD